MCWVGQKSRLWYGTPPPPPPPPDVPEQSFYIFKRWLLHPQTSVGHQSHYVVSISAMTPDCGGLPHKTNPGEISLQGRPELPWSSLFCLLLAPPSPNRFYKVFFFFFKLETSSKVNFSLRKNQEKNKNKNKITSCEWKHFGVQVDGTHLLPRLTRQ